MDVNSLMTSIIKLLRSLAIIFPLLLILKYSMNHQMDYNISEFNIADLLSHPSLEDNTDVQIESALLQTDALDLVDKCEDTLEAMVNHQRTGEIVLNKLVDLWADVANHWDPLKGFVTLINDEKVIKKTFTKWISGYLYENKILDMRITEGKEYKYRHLRRYVVLPSDRVKECWDLDKGTHIQHSYVCLLKNIL